MKITRLVKRGNYVYIYFAEQPYAKISYEIVVKSGLRKDDELTDDVWNEIVKEDEIYRLRNSAFRLLSRRAHSVSELRKKLKAKFDNVKAIESIITELIERDYLNDEKFAFEFMESRLARKKSGVNKIRAELMARGVPKKFIEAAVEQLADTEELTATAKELALKKLKVLRKKEDSTIKLKSKLYSFLQNRGFSFEICKSVVDELIR